jgi:amidase/aspartyl-tRNA(Asn)/glutamyl-tRNA(Gln) amidotransferase subunit A
VVNLLDGCALSLPCQVNGEMPVGLMVWSHAMQDDTVLAASLAIEATLAQASRAGR